jgi:protein-S-isoprenylcysteine O-methyltransferase Ste14
MDDADGRSPAVIPAVLNAALRTLVWTAAAWCWAVLKKPEGASFLAVRHDVVGFLGMVLLAAGIALHLWSNVILAQGEAAPPRSPGSLAARGPYRYVRNPIYLAGAPIFLGIYLLYGQWRAADLVAAPALAIVFHVLVVGVEEPALRKRLGSAYEEYCRRVPRWLPRLG